MADSITAHLLRIQQGWSIDTFGPGPRTKGVVDHIRKELLEIEAEPEDIEEWVDVMILAADGAYRAGASPQGVIDTYIDKLRRNMARQWPDWRTQPADRAIEHVRG
jgi:hypothetical protein